MEIDVLPLRDLCDRDRDEIVSHLTHQGSEFQAECLDRATGTPVSIIRSDADGVIAWACTHSWRGMQTLEGFTREPHRRKGYGKAVAFALIARDHVLRSEDVAVFSPEYGNLARSIGCTRVRIFSRVADDWIEVEPSGGPAPRVVG